MNPKYFIPILLFNSFVFSQTPTTYTYAIKGLDTLKLDVYSPKITKETDSLPVVLWMHGGGFSGGRRDNVDEVKMMEYLTEKGYIGITISYRLLRKGIKSGFGCDCPNLEKLNVFKQAVVDYFDAAKFVVDNKSLLKIDTSKIIAGGSSAGAEGVLNAIYLRAFFIDDLTIYEHIKFAGVFSLAGAIVDVDYISKSNAIPAVLFHGTDDNLVPFASTPHNNCSPEKMGYIILDGSGTIVEKLDALETSYYLHKVIGGRHEVCQIPFNELETVLGFFDKTIHNKETIQIKKIITKKP